MRDKFSMMSSKQERASSVLKARAHTRFLLPHCCSVAALALAHTQTHQMNTICSMYTAHNVAHNHKPRHIANDVVKARAHTEIKFNRSRTQNKYTMRGVGGGGWGTLMVFVAVAFRVVFAQRSAVLFSELCDGLSEKRTVELVMKNKRRVFGR